MHLAVLGGSGRLGQEVLKQALAHGWSVTTLVRKSGQLDTLASQNKNLLTIMIGDATNSTDVIKTIENADAVVHAVSVGLIHSKPTSLYSSTTQAVIDARPHTKAKHYVVMSSTGTHHIRKNMPRGIRHMYEYVLGDVADDKEQEELLLHASSLPWTIIKSPFLVKESISNLVNKTKKIHLTPFKLYKSSLFDIMSRNSIAKTILNIIANKTHIAEKVVPLVR